MNTGMVSGNADLEDSGAQKWLSLAQTAQHGARPGVQAPWVVVQRVDDVDPARAAKQALAELDGGATGLSLVFEGAPNAFGYGLPATRKAMETVLADVPLSRTYLRIDAHPASRATADWLVSFLTQRRADPAKLSLSFGIDPAAIFAGTGRLSMSIEALEASMPQSLAHFFALGIPGVLLEADGRVFHNAGATGAQELGAMLAAATTYLRLFAEARQALVYATPHIGFALSVDDDPILSAAKVKALRKLWTRVQKEAAIPPSVTTIHAETSYRMLSLNPEANVVRATIACHAAAAGGADSISVLPATAPFGLANAAARQAACNTQLVLADSGLSSPDLEPVIDKLSAAAWKEYQAIEAEGGMLASLAAGRLQERVLLARNQRPPAGAIETAQSMTSDIGTLDAQRRPLPTDGAVFCQRLDPAMLG